MADEPLPPSFIEFQVLLAFFCWINGSVLVCEATADRHGVTLGPIWVAIPIDEVLAEFV